VEKIKSCFVNLVRNPLKKGDSRTLFRFGIAQIIWIILFLIAVGASSVWGADPAQNDRKQVEPLSGVVEESRPAESNDLLMFQDGYFIVPNEYQPNPHLDQLQGKTGTLISVGTFRSLDMSAAGNFSRIVLIDIDSKVSAFNQLSLALIKKASNRREYLSLLLTGDSSAYQDSHSLNLNDLQYFEFLESRFVTRNSNSGILNKWRVALPDLEPRVFEELSDFNRPGRARDFCHGIISGAIAQFTRLDSLHLTILGSDVAFEKVRTLAIEDRYSIFTGNLSGKQTVSSIAQALAKSDEKISVIDVSNVPSYIRDTNQYRKNLAELPGTKDCTVLFSIAHVPPKVLDVLNLPRTEDGWTYFASLRPDYLAAATRHPERLNSDDFIYRIAPKLLAIRNANAGSEVKPWGISDWTRSCALALQYFYKSLKVRRK
jgi:hypothetical protein